MANVARAASKVESERAVELGARAGYAVSGLLHLLIAAIALKLAWSGSKTAADQSGALQALAANPLGRLMLWVAVVGFTALAVWQVASAFTSQAARDGSVWAERGKAVAKALVYLALAWTSLSFAKGRPRSSRAQSADFTAALLAHAGGRILLSLIGAVIVGVGTYHVMKGWTRKFLQDLSENPGALATRAGVVGYVAKGAALVVVGVLFVAAAVLDSSTKATGLDGALRTLRRAPMGVFLLTAVALGIAAYGVYSFARARFARL